MRKYAEILMRIYKGILGRTVAGHIAHVEGGAANEEFISRQEVYRFVWDYPRVVPGVGGDGQHGDYPGEEKLSGVLCGGL